MTRADGGSSAVVCASADRARLQLSELRNCLTSVTKRATRERAAIVTREMEGAVEMTATTRTKALQKESRDIELTRMLESRRRTLLDEVHGKIRDGRRDSTKEREVLDEGESSEVDIQDVDLGMSQVVDGDLVKVMSWYDNEWGYSSQLVREALRIAREIRKWRPNGSNETRERGKKTRNGHRCPPRFQDL